MVRWKNVPHVKLWTWIVIFISILCLSLIPKGVSSVIDDATSLGWNIAHIPAYMLLMLTTYTLLNNYFKKRHVSILLAALLISLSGMCIELIQPAFGRSRDLADFVFNEIGVGLGIIIAVIYRKGTLY